MNNVFSKANGYDAKQTNTGDNSEQIAAAQGYIRDGVKYLTDLRGERFRLGQTY